MSRTDRIPILLVLCLMLVQVSIMTLAEQTDPQPSLLREDPLSQPSSDTGDAAQIEIDRRSISGGYSHSCIIVANGSVLCSGENYGYQLGLGDTTDRLRFTNVALPAGNVAISIKSGPHNTCALLADDSLWCWGANHYKGINGVDYRAPSRIEDPTLLDLDGRSGIRSFDLSSLALCITFDDGELACRGGTKATGTASGSTRYSLVTMTKYDTAGQERVNLSVSAVAMGWDHTCAIETTGDVYCAGFNDRMQTGHSLISYRGFEKVDLPDGSPAVQIDVGRKHSCALLENGRLYCWGDGLSGQLGHARKSSSRSTWNPSLVEFDDGRYVTSFTAGDYSTCAILEDSSLWCWGDGAYGQLGREAGLRAEYSRSEPGPVDLGENRSALSVEMGSYFTCAVLEDRALKCWGEGSEGALGLGDRTERDNASAAPLVDLGDATGMKEEGSSFVTPSAFYPWNSELSYETVARIEATESTCTSDHVISSGDLFDGLLIDSGTGAISGSPTELGVRTVTIDCKKADGTSGFSNKFTIEVRATVPSGLSYSADNIAISMASAYAGPAPSITGGPVTSWSISPSLPAGLSLDQSDGSIDGTATYHDPIGGLYRVTANSAAGSTSTSIWLRTLAPDSQTEYGLKQQITVPKWSNYYSYWIESTNITGLDRGGCKATIEWSIPDTANSGTSGWVWLKVGDDTQSEWIRLGGPSSFERGDDGRVADVTLSDYYSRVAWVSIWISTHDAVTFDELNVTLTGDEWNCKVEPLLSAQVDQRMSEDLSAEMMASEDTTRSSILMLAAALGLLLTLTMVGALMRARRRQEGLSWAAEIQAAFDAYDEDGDGILSPVEIQEMFRDRVVDDVGAFLAAFDDDVDGTISRAEVDALVEEE